MKVDDIGALLIFTIIDPSDTVVNLTGATTALLCIYTGKVLTSHTMLFYNTTGGQVAYQVASGDLPTTGIYKFEVRIGYPTGNVFTSSRTFDVVQPTLCP